MKIEVQEDTPGFFPADTLPAGTIGITHIQFKDEDIFVLKTTNGLVSLDGEHVWIEKLSHTKDVRPLPPGTIIKITI